jgi:hypothetical protein
MFAVSGVAMPDGSYFIRPDHPEDLTNAIRAVGRASGSDGKTDEQQRNAVRRHIMKRASALKRTSEIPASWNPDGTLKHMNADDILEHFGVKGMRWGVHRSRSAQAAEREAGIRSTSSSDAARAHNAEVKAKTTGIHSLSNEELQHLVTRMNLEKQISVLTTTPKGKSNVSKGRDFVENQTKTAKIGISAYKTGKEVAKIIGPLLVAAAAGAAASRATGGHSGPVRMPQLAITSG